MTATTELGGGLRDTPLQDDRFLLLETLGRGGMGSVFRAFDRAEQRLVALKVPAADQAAGPSHPFSEEFEIWSQLRHPAIVRAYELGLARRGPIARGSPYLVLEHVRGGPSHRVLRPGKAPTQQLVAAAAQLLSALEEIHRSGFIHRDLKPANVLVDSADGERPAFKLTDFGLAAPIGTTRGPGLFSGSLPYVAPEALIGRPLDGRSDLYGLGLLLYYLATGEMPMDRPPPRAILRWHLSDEPADPSHLRCLPASLTRLVRRLTARDPLRRPATAGEALELLGLSGDRSGEAPARAAAHDGVQAGLRLALDAVRLGAGRAWRFPAARARSELDRRAAVWAQVRGMRFHRLRDDPSRLVLRLACELGPAGVDLIRRFGLERHLALQVVGGAPLLDPHRRREKVTPASVRRAARGVCELLLLVAAERSMVLVVEPVLRPRPLNRELTRRLLETVLAAPGPTRGRGGLLLLLPPERARTGGDPAALEIPA